MTALRSKAAGEVNAPGVLNTLRETGDEAEKMAARLRAGDRVGLDEAEKVALRALHAQMGAVRVGLEMLAQQEQKKMNLLEEYKQRRYARRWGLAWKASLWAGGLSALIVTIASAMGLM